MRKREERERRASPFRGVINLSDPDCAGKSKAAPIRDLN